MTKVDETPKYNFKNEIRDEIVQMVFRNPFYNVHVKDFRKFMKNIKEEEIITKDFIMEEMIEKYIENEEDIHRFIFRSVVNFSFDRFTVVFRENELDDEIIPIIFNILFLFLTQRQKGIKKEMKNDLCLLFDKIKLEVKVGKDSEKIKFKTGRFSFLVLNLIQMCSFCFLNFFCGPATLKIAGNFGQEDLNIIFSDEKSKSSIFQPENINKIVNHHLNEINIIVQPQLINALILSQALQPISDYIRENKDEEVFWIDSLKLIDIFDVLIDKMDYENYIDIFFNTGDES